MSRRKSSARDHPTSRDGNPLAQYKMLVAYDCQQIEFDYHNAILLEMGVDLGATSMRWLGRDYTIVESNRSCERSKWVAYIHC